VSPFAAADSPGERSRWPDEAAADLPPDGPVRHPPRNASLVVGGTIAAAVVLAALVSLVWTPDNPLAVDPALRLAGPSATHLLGTDEYGRDVLSRLMAGSQVTMYVGTLTVLIAVGIGLPAGLVAAQRGGIVGQVVLRLADLVYGFPALLTAIVLAAAIGASTSTVALALGIAYVPVITRVTRSTALVVLGSDYVLAARAYGRRPLAILRRHVLPGIATTLVAQMSLLFSLAVLAEAALDYLGLGTTAPTPSWGAMLQDGQSYLGSDVLLTVWPSLAIFLCVLGFSLLADGVADRRHDAVTRAGASSRTPPS
jgi:peptide/nickel transport system permease protein